MIPVKIACPNCGDVDLAASSFYVVFTGPSAFATTKCNCGSHWTDSVSFRDSGRLVGAGAKPLFPQRQEPKFPVLTTSELLDFSIDLASGDVWAELEAM